jgi:hypothetical protein
MQFVRCNLINKHGSSSHQGEVLIVPTEIESIRSFVHTDHIYAHHEIGSIVTMKTGDKHYVSQHVDGIAEMLQVVEESNDGVIGR